MQDMKNIFIAWVSAAMPIAAAMETTAVSVISAIVLPIIFFTVGKAVDVAVQVWFRRREERRTAEERK